MNRFGWLFLLFFIGCGFTAKSQKPDQPHKDSIYVTIDLDTGNPTIYWAPPTFYPPTPTHPAPTGYIIYKRIVDALHPNGSNEAIDTVGPGVKSYTDFTSNGNNEKLTYLLASNGPTEKSQLSRLHSNIFITSFYDSCNHKIDLEWNLYQGWDNNKIHDYYYLYVGNDPVWGSYVLKDSISKFTTHYSLTNVNENQDYYFYLEAKRNDAPFATHSNLYHRFTKMPIHPAEMLVDSVIAEDEKVNIFFSIDTLTELTDFQLVRWENSDSVKSIFSKKMIYEFSDPKTTFFADTNDNWAARTRPFYYKVDAINTCPKIVKVTNLANSITPKVQSKGMKNNIQWDPLFIDPERESSGNYILYHVMRYAYTTVPLPVVLLPETSDTEISDDVSGFEGQGYSIKFCYQIEGFERNMLGSFAMMSRSRIQCTEIVPGVTMPDAFVPTDHFVNNGNPRNIFIPIITFKANYTLTIYNRWGSLVFSGENKGWNGHLSSGQLAQEGTYVYRLVVHTLGNRDVTKLGSVALIYN
jgi:hypothetical protein